jgi:hypothetical protein
VSAASAVKLKPAGREIALWSGVKQEHIPQRFATLERMLDETDAGKTLKKLLESGKWDETKWSWFELSDRTATLAAENNKEPLHYFVSADRGYYEALHPTESAIAKWWPSYQNELIAETRSRLATKGADSSAIEREVSAQKQRLSTWTDDRIKDQYYATMRTSKRARADGTRAVEDEIFHKLEKLKVSGAWVHELNENGVEVRRWWQQL